MSARFATTPAPPYYAVIFSNQRSGLDDGGYGQMATHMDVLARSQPGCLGLESTRDAEGFGITVSYWADEAAILAWKEDARHLVAQELGKDAWYRFYHLRVARVERGYTGPAGR
ncbi:MAG: antibiotic biosynthesis monooxygenase [Pseudomonadota bacterium]